MDDEFPPAPNPAELGLPNDLPPIRLPGTATLAEHARTSALLARVRQVAKWLEDRKPVVDDYLFNAADIADATSALRCSANEFKLLWGLALDVGFVDATADDARPDEGLADWLEGPDEAVLDVWDAALEFVLAESVLYDGDLDPEYDPDLSVAGPSLMFALFLAGSDGLPRDELRELVHLGLVNAFGGDPLEVVDDPTAALLERLLELGAVAVESETIRATPLALWAMRERYVAVGVDVPLIPPIERMTAADLLAAAPGFTEEEFAAETRTWLARHDPGQAGEELLLVAADGGAVARMLAVQLIRSSGLGTEALWRSALSRPEVRPYARIELGGEQPGTVEIAWLLTDVLAAMGDVEDSFTSAVPAGQEQEIFDAMWRLPHPNAHEVLTLIGEEHPDKKIAKAARRAAFKARS